MNKNLPNQSYDSRIEHQIIFNKFTVGTGNTPTNWKQSLRTKQFDNIQTAQQTPFLFAVSDVVIKNLYNITITVDENDEFILEESGDGGGSYSTLTLTIPAGNYSLETLCNILNSQVALVQSAPGHYNFRPIENNKRIEIIYTPVGGTSITTNNAVPTANTNELTDNYKFALVDFGSRTTEQQATYTVFGLQNTNDEEFVRYIYSLDATVVLNIDALFLTCDKLRYATQIASNDNTNIITQTLLMIPSDLSYFNPKELNWVQTLGFPFENVINWRIVDIYGNEINTSTDFEIKFVLYIQTIGSIKVI